METKKAIKDKFISMLIPLPEASFLVNFLQERAELLLFGGCVREYFDSEFQKMPRDVDIVVKSDYNLKDLLDASQFHYETNKFGGYKLVLNQMKFDFWELHNTWAFKANKVHYNQTEDLSQTVFLNMDSIFYNLNTYELFHKGYTEAMESRYLDIILSDNPYPELSIAKAFKFKQQYDLKFSQNIIFYIENWIKRSNLNEAARILQKVQTKRYSEFEIDWISELEKISYNKKDK